MYVDGNILPTGKKVSYQSSQRKKVPVGKNVRTGK